MVRRMSQATDMHVALRRALAARNSARETEMRRMLGLWVSELEPCAVYARDSGGEEHLVGLTCQDFPIGSMPPIIIRARDGTP